MAAHQALQTSVVGGACCKGGACCYGDTCMSAVPAASSMHCSGRVLPVCVDSCRVVVLVMLVAALSVDRLLIAAVAVDSWRGTYKVAALAHSRSTSSPYAQ